MRYIFLALAALLSACAYQSGSGYAPAYSTPTYYGAGTSYGGLGTPWNNGYAGSDRFSPKKGLTCDRSRHICYDRYGVDYYATDEYLGKKSAKRGVKKYGDQAFIFAPQQGVICDRRSQSCSDGNGLNAALTRKYFSKGDTRRVAGWTGADMFAPQAGVACNRTTQICSNSAGPNVDLTQVYFGRQAAVDLANQQNQPVAPLINEPAPAAAPVATPELPAPDAGVAIPSAQPAETPAMPEPVAPVAADPAPQMEPAAMPQPMPEPGPVAAPVMPEPVPMPAPEAAPAPAACEGEACPQ